MNSNEQQTGNLHSFAIGLFPKSPLVGLKISNEEIKFPDSEEWVPSFKIDIGVLFITFSYEYVSFN